MTKKVLSLLVVGAVATTLVACGNTTKKAPESTCDAYLNYVQCASEKAGMSTEDAKNVVEQTKAAWKGLPQEEMEKACVQAVDMLKNAPAVEGCEVPAGTEKANEEEEKANEEEKTNNEEEMNNEEETTPTTGENAQVQEEEMNNEEETTPTTGEDVQVQEEVEVKEVNPANPDGLEVETAN